MHTEYRSFFDAAKSFPNICHHFCYPCKYVKTKNQLVVIRILDKKLLVQGTFVIFYMMIGMGFVSIV